MATNTYVALQTQVLSSTATSVTFSSISQGYTDLVIVANNLMSGASGFKLRFNGDSSALYSQTHLQGYAGAAYSGRISGATSITNNLVFGDSTTANVFTPHTIQLQNYSNTTTNKTLLWRYGTTTAAGGNGEVAAIVGLWRSTAAITSVEISVWNAVNFSVGSSFTLYGIAAEGTGYATGGLITSDATYYYHAFTSSGTFTPSKALTADILVVAGGGGAMSGGGGAGGLLTFTSQSLTNGTGYTCTVGAGGAGISGNSAGAGKGSNSQFGSLTACVGGGAGGGAGSATYKDGGSGGGAGDNGAAGTYKGLGTTGQGSDGGEGVASSPYPAGGGGGAGAVGSTAANANTAGNGGIGATSTLINAIGTATGFGQLSGGNYYFAGGGGASFYSSGTTPGTGGLGGGGNGANGNGVSGTPNTGGGAGGALAASGTGGTGGSGIVIVRYAK